jgi:hypothetical protein
MHALLRVAIVVSCVLLPAGCSRGGQGAAPAAKTLSQVLASNADQVDAAAAAARAGVNETGVAQQVKADVQASRSSLLDQLSAKLGTGTEEEHQQALKAACLASDSYQYRTASDQERQLIVRSQGELPESKVAGVVGVANDLAKMKSGSDAEKVAASFACLIGTNLQTRSGG